MCVFYSILKQDIPVEKIDYIKTIKTTWTCFRKSVGVKEIYF